MRRAVLYVAVAIFASTLPLRAQTALTVTASHCSYKESDKASWEKTDWTQPAFDDSGWQSSAPNFDPNFPSSPYVQTRCRLDLRSLERTGLVFIQIETFSAWELFVDGESIGSFGDMKDGSHTMDIVQRRPIPESLAARGVVLLALRETRRAPAPFRYSARVTPISAGAEKTLADETVSAELSAFKLRRLQFFCYGFIGTAGIFFLILSNLDKERHDLLWIGLVAVGTAELRVNELAQVFLLHYPRSLDFFFTWIGQWLLIPYVLLFFSLSERRVPRAYFFIAAYIPSVMLLPLFSYVFSPRTDQILWWYLCYNPVARVLVSSFGVACALVPFTAFWPLSRIPRRNLPIFAAALLWASGEAVNMATRLPWLTSVDPTAFVRNYRAVVSVPAVIGMFFLLARRQRQAMEERTELQNEMKAAQEIQRLLAPAQLDLEPWLTIDVAYLPAKEVGGDFYFYRRMPLGQQVVVGDVSGKGLKAAMTVSAIVGALRTMANASPGEVLNDLNRGLSGHLGGGFVTCCATLISPDGTVTIANAGHLRPYRNGEEMPVEPDLPLGITPDADYSESAFALAHGEQLTLLTDGILEATSPTGELFGFARTQALSSQNANQIASTAQQFGQEDDITVLTIRRV